MTIKLNHCPRILITRTDRIGDFVLSTPVFAALRKAYPEAYLAGLTFCHNRDLIVGNPNLNEVILYDKNGSEKSWWGNLIFAWSLRKKKFDLVIHLHATNRMHWITWLAGIPNRLGWSRRMPWALTCARPYVKKEGTRHEAYYNFDLLEELGIACPERLETYFPIQARALISLEEFLKQINVTKKKPWVVINPSASDPAKRWPAASYGALVNQMNQKYDLDFFVIGSLKDREAACEVQSHCSRDLYDLSGHLSLSMLGVFLKEAALLISNDSGPVHIAQAVGTPVVSIFVRNEPGLSWDRWRPLYENSQVIENNAMAVSDVMKAISKLNVFQGVEVG